VDEHVTASLTRDEAEASVRVEELRCTVHSVNSLPDRITPP
jgi:hypothetical protein